MWVYYYISGHGSATMIFPFWGKQLLTSQAFGPLQHWLYWYFISSLGVSQLIRKALNIGGVWYWYSLLASRKGRKKLSQVRMTVENAKKCRNTRIALREHDVCFARFACSSRLINGIISTLAFSVLSVFSFRVFFLWTIDALLFGITDDYRFHFILNRIWLTFLSSLFREPFLDIFRQIWS